MIQLDSNFVILALGKGSPQDRALRGWLKDGTPTAISSIAWTEFLCGPFGPGELELARRFVHRVLPFTEEGAAIAAELFNHGGRRRGSLVDCMVAATAISHDAPLATSNPVDFRRMEARGLQMIAL